jgi:hypothetical protein
MGNGSVGARLNAIIGDTIRQTELLALRRALFKDLLPPITRDEQRTRIAHVITLERHWVPILDCLDRREGIGAVVEAVLTSRNNKRQEWKDVLMHIMLNDSQ